MTVSKLWGRGYYNKLGLGPPGTRTWSEIGQSEGERKSSYKG